MHARTSTSPERLAVASIPVAIACVLAFAVSRGVGIEPVPAIALVVVAGAVAAIACARRLPPALDGSLRRRPIVACAWFALGVASVAATARLGVFMVDESRAECSVFPFEDFFVHHSCSSAYFEAARLQRAGVENVYERTLYEGPEGEPRFLGDLVVDVYLYPPPFLLLPRLGLAVSEDFRAWRAVWFGIAGAIVMAALVVLAGWIGGEVGLRAALLAPFVWLSLPALTTLQFGNFHVVAISIAVLAMLAFEREQHALGGALLAFVSVGKIFPAVLVLYLVFRRRWRSVAWTVGFSAAFVVLALLVLGRDPFAAFLHHHLPRLSSGAAFETLFAHDDTIACNHAIYGVVQKLGLLGVPGMSQGTASTTAWVYGVALVGVAFVAARVREDRLTKALVWLALLQLSALRSPFSPDVYAQVAILWIVTLLLASVDARTGIVALCAALVAANHIVPTEPTLPMRTLVVLTLAQQLAFIGVCLWIVLARSKRLAPRASPRLAE